MLSSHHSNDILNNDLNIQINESHNLLFKLFASLLTNPAIQTGLRQITRISQPLLGKFDDSVIKITSNVTRWVSNKNIYNQLAKLWLNHHFPFDGQIMPYEDFARHFEALPRRQKFIESEEIFQSFYSYASQIWKALNEPSLEDLRNAILEIVAQTINQVYHLKEEVLATTLYNITRMLIEKRREFVSGESFLNLVRINVGEDFCFHNSQAIKSASNEYYIFAKRFVLIEFPLATNHKDVWKLIVNFIQENSYFYGDSTLNFVEKRLDFCLRFLGQKYENNIHESKLSEKAQRILHKAFLLSISPLKMTENAVSKLQTTKAYNTVDSYLHITDRFKDIVFISEFAFNIVRANLIDPSFDMIKFIAHKTKSTISIVMKGVNIPVLKKNYRKLYTKFEILKQCVVAIVGETLNIIFDKEALLELGDIGKKELYRFYNEVRTLEKEKIKNLGIEYYSNLIKKANKTYKSARRTVYYKKRQLGDQEISNDLKSEVESESSDNSSQPLRIQENDK